MDHTTTLQTHGVSVGGSGVGRAGTRDLDGLGFRAPPGRSGGASQQQGPPPSSSSGAVKQWNSSKQQKLQQHQQQHQGKRSQNRRLTADIDQLLEGMSDDVSSYLVALLLVGT